MSGVQLTVDLEVLYKRGPFVVCKLPSGKEWAVPEEIFQRHTNSEETVDVTTITRQEMGVDTSDKLYLVVNPKSDAWEFNKDWIKGNGGTYVPDKKCWVLCWDGYDLDDPELHSRVLVFGVLHLPYLPVGNDLLALVAGMSTGRYAQPMTVRQLKGEPEPRPFHTGLDDCYEDDEPDGFSMW